MTHGNETAGKPMTRILIIGCPGGGKSTLAVRLGRALEIPVVHLDRLFWRTGWTNVTSEEFDRQLEEALMQDAFLMDGNFSRTLPRRLERAQAVIWLDYPRVTCLTGALWRVLRTYGRTRPDMGEGCPERFDPEFLEYIWSFRERILPEVLEAIEKAPDVHLFRLGSRRACNAFFRRAVREGGVFLPESGA